MLEGLKIEDINKIVDIHSPIININKLFKTLEDRVILGFGGVSEYGITARWNKNFLLILAIIIYRQKRCKIYSGMQFNAVLNTNDAIKLGFQHIALCMGAGSPKLLDLENNLYNGIKTASDFLMSLHLGAFKKDNLFNLQIQLPLIVLGGGLSAIDCATEAGIYYLRQLEKHIPHYEQLCSIYSTKKINSFFNSQEMKILNTFLKDYKTFQVAKNSNKAISNYEIIKSMGGIKIVYYKTLQESQAYKLNYKEVNNALSQGIDFLENMDLKKINLDKFNTIESLTFNHKGEEIKLNAKTLIIAIGNENNAYNVDFDNKDINPIFHNSNLKFKTFKGKSFSILQGFINQEISCSYFGDMHPMFSGSVVKAMASTFLGQYEVNHLLKNIKTKSIPFVKIIKKLDKLNTHKIIKNIALNPYTSEISIKSKQLSLSTAEGQFIKVQNFYDANNTYLSSENIMLGIIKNNKKTHIITSVVLNNGASTTNFSSLNNCHIQATGGLGEPTKLQRKQNLLLISGGIASYSFLPTIKQAYKLKNNIIMLSGYKNEDDMFYHPEFKKYCNNWQVSLDNIKKPTSEYIKGNIVDNLNFYMQNSSKFAFSLQQAHTILIAGSSAMMEAVQKILKESTNNAICSLNNPMNCGMKGLCSTCIQKQTINNKANYFYSCKCQEQQIQNIDFSFLNARLQQNSLQEKLSHLWLKSIYYKKN
jgi:NAD(P)H-flavin reductase